ncbi:PREDICTED: high affinity copper uptake protein 1-like [Dufourea novaeangliae]|uniref:high affinity copper uptake protein 1-like n=1 Tax=Dufourea novaeangliae TaxID=178035 RepID=UPI0007678177|nr:PREDICTED: high affinity copper uptake protein 1-like [Dufourea novaeangliae]
MHMSFHFGENEIILFNEWHVVDSQGLGWSIVGIILLVTIYEGIKSYRDHLYVQTARFSKLSQRRPRAALLFSKVHIIQTIAHIIQLIIGYFLMLIFMTYNVWLCLAVAIGTGIGYWLFSWERSSGDNMDCCF